MKRPLILLALLGSLTAVKAQTKLPTKATITLTDKQVIRIDSAINIAMSRDGSKQFTNWFLQSFNPFYEQIKLQLVVDTAKKIEKLPNNKP